MTDSQKQEKVGNWLEALQLELDFIEDAHLVEPEGEVEANEKIVGEASAVSRKLFTFARKLEAEANRFFAEAISSPKKDDRQKAQTGYVRLKTKSDVVRAIFWLQIKDELDLWGDDGDVIGIRAGWKVVSFSNSRGTISLRDFFKIE
ncbi:MAG: hypothetical protein HY602_00835 [Parcubacteria group bacterium]|nr:hypothetical protein [Parcubacteria group bacterium]